ncbi:MAG: outer membrane protein assembly factor BamA [Deltaproteobacteria bacterium]|nr:outer membrane protein assembly factor BamA [Deltaproteobacteria bacterium]
MISGWVLLTLSGLSLAANAEDDPRAGRRSDEQANSKADAKADGTADAKADERPAAAAVVGVDQVVRLQFEGLRRVEATALRAVMSTRVGRAFSPAALAEDIRAIYALGYFEDVRAFREGPSDDGWTIVFVLKEKPGIRRVQIRGNDDLSTEDIKAVVDIRPFTILNAAKVRRNEGKIRDLYNEKGFYLAEVTSKIERRKNNQVDVIFEVNEHAKVEVRRIRFIGNRNLSTDLLKSSLITQEGNLISFLTNAGTYRKDAFQVDLLRLTSQYFDNGYINVKVDTPDVEISADRKYVYISIAIEEGEQYSVGALDFEGDLLDSKELLKERLSIAEGEIFSRSKLGQDLLSLKTRYEDDGYAYANITPVTKVDADKRLISITFDIQKGQKVYYERINIVGNTKTRDKVVRRELRIYEGELTSASMRDLSRRRVMALGYFESVDVKTRRGSEDDLQIVDIEIKEKATGTFQIGAGFSSAENFIATAQISQENFLGRGQSVALTAQISSLRQLFQLRFTEPYFLDTDWTLSLNAFNTETQYRSFARSSTGGDLTLGHPITDDLRLYLTYSLEFVQSRGSDGFSSQPAFAALNNRGRISSLQGTIAYDTRDNRLFPSSGMYHSASAEVSSTLLGASDTRSFQRYRVYSRFYYPLFWNFVAKLSLRGGLLNATASQGLSPSEKFIMGGINTIRGYAPFTVGPERRATRNARGNSLYDAQSSTFVFVEGGNKEFLGNFEIEFPIFEAVGIKGVVFLDAGNVYAEEENFFYLGHKVRAPQRQCGNGESLGGDFCDADGNLRFDPLDLPLGLYWSVGFGFRWFSPIGPLRFEWGIPLTRRPTDDPGPLFEFSIGNSF